MDQPNYYAILGVSPNASKQAITQAYRRLAQTFHPDLHPPERKGWAVEQMKQINQAYTVLSDPEARERYDATNTLPWRPRPAKAESDRWMRVRKKLQLVIYLVLAAFLLAGAYLILVAWRHMLVNPLQAELFPWQWVFALVWFFVLGMMLVKVTPSRR